MFLDYFDILILKIIKKIIMMNFNKKNTLKNI